MNALLDLVVDDDTTVGKYNTVVLCVCQRCEIVLAEQV